MQHKNSVYSYFQVIQIVIFSDIVPLSAWWGLSIMQPGWYGCQETDEPSTVGPEVLCLWPMFHMQCLCVDSCLAGHTERHFLLKLQLALCCLVASCLRKSPQTGFFLYIYIPINQFSVILKPFLKYLELIIVRISFYSSLFCNDWITSRGSCSNMYKFITHHVFPFDSEPIVNWKLRSFMCERGDKYLIIVKVMGETKN